MSEVPSETAGSRDLSALEALHRRAVEGDTEAFWALIEPFGGLIFSVAFGMLNDADRAHDVLHDVYVQAWRSLGGLRRSERLASWLYSMTRHRCSDLMRRDARADHSLREAAARQPQVIPIYDVLIRNEDLQRMSEAVAGLPEAFREVLALKYMSGLKCREIAEALDISLSAVKTRLFEARRLLARRMQDLQVRSRAASDGGRRT
ncbi:MAG: RNA polymerase sigma factor [Candidatus Sumerlaeia bacterium]